MAAVTLALKIIWQWLKKSVLKILSSTTNKRITNKTKTEGYPVNSKITVTTAYDGLFYLITPQGKKEESWTCKNITFISNNHKSGYNIAIVTDLSLKNKITSSICVDGQKPKARDWQSGIIDPMEIILENDRIIYFTRLYDETGILIKKIRHWLPLPDKKLPAAN